MSDYLEDELAPRVQIHGVLVDVFSLGTLILGDAGIGKSECALELVYRGHRLVADDIVVIRRTHAHGSARIAARAAAELPRAARGGHHRRAQALRHDRDVPVDPDLARDPAVKLSPESKKLEQKWREQMMENPQSWTSTETILGIEVPLYTMVVAPGRDLAIMVETAVRKCLLAQRGIQDERDFLEVINEIAARRQNGDWNVDDD